MNKFTSLLTTLLLGGSTLSFAQSGPYFSMGTATNPAGQSVLVNSQGVVMNGKPVIPVMGEMHFSRVPEREWKREILKMKAGGVTVLATYVFWIHHEDEVEGQWDWSGNKNLRRFIETCKEADMPVVLRIGPFCHGEVYQGGMPCWLVKKAAQDKKQYGLRSTAPGFIEATAKLYNQIGAQVNGLMWKDGGPIIGVQIENECRGPWAYFTTLLDLAKKAGLDAPIYTRTGWPAMNGKAEFGKILPLYGDYADGFWDRKLTDMPGEYPQAFVMKEGKVSGTIATETFSKDEMTDAASPSTLGEQNRLSYPYLTCELGGGMMPSYHRRINMSGREAMPLCVCKLGSGSNLPGYYMYHGGTNPLSPYHTMAETQASTVTNYNDMPLMTYDFQTILGEMGQPNSVSWNETRWAHQFLADWGDELSQMPVDTMSEHYARRGCFVFRNDYVRILNEEGQASITPQNMVWEGLTITSEDVQPFAKADGGLYFIALNKATQKGKTSSAANLTINGKRYIVKADQSLNVGGKTITVLSPAKAMKAYAIGGKMHYADSGILYADGNSIVEETWTPINIYKVETTQLKQEGKLRNVPMGTQKVAAQPTDADFEQAAVWEIKVPALDASSADNNRGQEQNFFLSISYRGDCARLYADGVLVQDNFWNGKTMQVRLADLVGKRVELKVLPLGKDAPIYLQKEQREVLDAAKGNYLLALDEVKVIERKDIVKGHLKPVINVIGDSYVANHRDAKENTWHARLADKMGMVYQNYGRNGSCIAFDRTHDGKYNFGPAMWQRYKTMDQNADYVLIIAGHNDAVKVGNNRDSLAMFCDSLETMLCGIEKHCPKARIGFVTPWYVDVPGFAPVSEAIKKACQKHHIPVLWNHSKDCVIKVRDDEFRRQYFQGNGINDHAHLNKDGHTLFLPVAEEWFLKRVVKKGVKRE